MVKPGGTGRPSLLISARLAPLAAEQILHLGLAFGAAVAKSYRPISSSSTYPSICEKSATLVEGVADLGKEPQTVGPQLPILAINGHAGKKFIDRGAPIPPAPSWQR